MSPACAQIERIVCSGGLTIQVKESGYVGLGEVIDMDIVADAGSVWRWVVRAKDCQRLGGPLGGTKRQRNQVGFGFMVFAYVPFF